MSLFAHSLLVPLVALLLVSGSRSEELSAGYPKTASAARVSAWQAITGGKGSGAAVAVMDRGKIVFSEGMGVRDRGRNLVVDSHTRFNIGSTSKMFTTVAMLMLVDEGKVSLDQPVVSYLPEFKMPDPRHRDITVGMLFNHSSGLPGTSFTMGYAATHNAHQVLLETLAHERLKHPPGALSAYCNDGFTLAEILIQKVSGKSYLAFLQERIFSPLGMHDTGASLGELAPKTDLAEFYDAKSARKFPVEVAEVHGAGGLSSTMEDLCRFGNSLTPFGKRLLSDASLRILRSAQPTPFSRALRNRTVFSSFGWDYSDLSPYDRAELQVLAKGGNTPGYSTNLQILPDQGMVIAMAISGNASGEMLTRPILEGLLEDRSLAQPVSRPAVRPPRAQPVPVDLDRFQGVYTGEGSAPLRMAVSADRQSVTWTPLTPVGQPADPPVASYGYHDGLLFDAAGKSAYLLSVDGIGYLVATPSQAVNGASIYGADWLSLQQVKTVERPREMPAMAAGKRWLLRNAPTFVTAPWVDLTLTPIVYDGLPGYLDFAGLKKVESPTLARVAATHFRDQSELELDQRGGTTWARVANYLYSVNSPALTDAGANSVTIGSEGHNEWLELADDAVVEIQLPPEGRAIILTAPKTILFDSVLDSGQLYTPKGALVFCAGPPGSRFVVSVE